MLLNYQFPRYTGDYIAYCEGDDYWTDPQKLQKQIDFLEAHPDFIAVGHNVRFVDDDGNPYADEVPKRWTSMPDYEYTVADANEHQMFGQTASRVYRNFWRGHPELFDYWAEAGNTHGDMKLSLIAVCLGRVWFMSDVMSCYRKSLTNSSYSARSQGVNQSRRKILSLREKIDFAAKLGVKLDYKKEYDKTLWMAFVYSVKRHTEKDREDFKYVSESYSRRWKVPFVLFKYFIKSGAEKVGRYLERKK